MIDTLVDILVCTQCKGPLKISSEKTALQCWKCMLSYPVKKGLPEMEVGKADVIADVKGEE